VTLELKDLTPFISFKARSGGMGVRSTGFDLPTNRININLDNFDAYSIGTLVNK
jgi:hypothetical protein